MRDPPEADVFVTIISSGGGKVKDWLFAFWDASLLLFGRPFPPCPARSQDSIPQPPRIPPLRRQWRGGQGERSAGGRCGRTRYQNSPLTPSPPQWRGGSGGEVRRGGEASPNTQIPRIPPLRRSGEGSGERSAGAGGKSRYQKSPGFPLAPQGRGGQGVRSSPLSRLPADATAVVYHDRDAARHGHRGRALGGLPRPHRSRRRVGDGRGKPAPGTGGAGGACVCGSLGLLCRIIAMAPKVRRILVVLV